MTALPDWSVVTDAELASAAAAGDRRAFASIYDRYADRLHDFCIGLVRDRDAAADCVHDAFCTAATRLTTLRDPDKLRPWLYAIVRNEALRWIRQRRREQVTDDLPDVATAAAGPDTLAARSELADLVGEVAGGLSERDRTVLDLTYRHGLDGPELADALGVSDGNATKIVFRLRETVERSLGALLVARRGRHAPDPCPELGAILASWDGRFTILVRKRVARHIESCPRCDEERRRLVNPVALLGGAPVFIPAPDWLRRQTLGDIELTCATTTPSAGGHAGRARGHGSRHRPDVEAGIGTKHTAGTNRARRAALYAAGLVAVVGLTMLWLYRSESTLAPTSPTTTQSTPAPPLTTPGGGPPAPPRSTTAPTPTISRPASQPPAPAQPSAPAGQTSPPRAQLEPPPPASAPPVVPPAPAQPAAPAPMPAPARVVPPPVLPHLPPLLPPALPQLPQLPPLLPPVAPRAPAPAAPRAPEVAPRDVSDNPPVTHSAVVPSPTTAPIR